MYVHIHTYTQYTLQKRNDIDFQSLIQTLVDMTQATKDQDAHGKQITLYRSETVSLGIHRHMCEIGMGEMSVSVITTTSLDDNLTTAMYGSYQTLHSTL